MKNKKLLGIALLVLVIAGAASWYKLSHKKEVVVVPTPQPTPPAANTANKITYLKASADMIVVDLPYPGAVTGKEFSVMGKARGPWYFEASFPIELLDKDGNSLATSHAEAQDSWMTTEFVPFKGTITAPTSYIGPATLVLHKDNPSGLPENEASMSFPITIEY